MSNQYRDEHAKMASLRNLWQKGLIEVHRLSKKDPGRKGHVQKLKITPVGENSTLVVITYCLGEHHVQLHFDHLRVSLALSAK